MTGARIELWCYEPDTGSYLVTYTVQSEHVLVLEFVKRARDRLCALHGDSVVDSQIVPLPPTGEHHALAQATPSSPSPVTRQPGTPPGDHANPIASARTGPGDPSAFADSDADELARICDRAYRVPQL